MTDVKITALEATEPKTNIVASHSLIAFQKSAQQRTESRVISEQKCNQINYEAGLLN